MTKSMMLTLRVHVHGPIQYILWPQSTYIGTPLRLKYVLYGYMEPKGKSMMLRAITSYHVQEPSTS